MQAFDRHYIVRSGTGCPGRPTRMVNKRAALGLLLHFYSCTADVKVLCEVLGSSPSTTARIIQQAELAMDEALGEIPEAAIWWPSAAEKRLWES
ncbi:hypothetical protein PsorP6_004374 [Peronosclerospora sorghi]|uniref:Uncharacterized protein n=1 Tax=Peronosclerospora sorghi TaxID=230839 RepID=A0ACC0VQI3_9STRA|nr:hypothetical protein PsorP6_004374 [Peronosclerospora sorghi]